MVKKYPSKKNPSYPLAHPATEKDAKDFFLAHNMPASEYAANFLRYHGDGEWPLQVLLEFNYRSAELNLFIQELRPFLVDHDRLLLAREKYLTPYELDEITRFENGEFDEDEEDEEDEEEPISADSFLKKMPKGFFETEILEWAVEWQNTIGILGSGIALVTDLELSHYGLVENSDITLFATEADGTPFAIWNAGGERYPVICLDSELDNYFVVSENFSDFMALLACGFIHLPGVWGEKEKDEITVPDSDMKKYRRALKRKFQIKKPGNPRNTVKKANLVFPHFLQWAKDNVVSIHS